MTSQTHADVSAKTQAGHTPGLWTVRLAGPDGGMDRIVAPNPAEWAKNAGAPYNEANVALLPYSLDFPAMSRANARLIAAAPELLAALKGARDALRKALPFCPPDAESVFAGEWLGEVEAAILKAEGGK